MQYVSVNIPGSVMGLAFFKNVNSNYAFCLVDPSYNGVWLEQRENKEQEREQRTIKAKFIKDSRVEKRRKHREKMQTANFIKKKKPNSNTENIRQHWNWFDYSQRWQLLSPRRWRENLFSAPSGGTTQTQKLTKPRRDSTRLSLKVTQIHT